jgi:hypothetical protein
LLDKAAQMRLAGIFISLVMLIVTSEARDRGHHEINSGNEGLVRLTDKRARSVLLRCGWNRR